MAEIKFICNAADRCGFSFRCPHAKPHDSFGVMCEEGECLMWQRQRGIGRKRSRCWCVPVVEMELAKGEYLRRGESRK